MRLRYLLIALLSVFTLTACNRNQSTDNSTLKVGTIAGPETELMETAKQIAKNQYGLDIKIIEFSDYNIPNVALAEGSLDANMFQHKPYLDAQVEYQHLPLISAGKTFIYPMGIYSDKIKNISDLGPDATIAIPNDPSNEARALLLLQKAKVLKLKSGANINATKTDIASLPDDTEVKEIDAAQLPRVLPDVSLAVINTNFAVPAGLSPSKDALFSEDKDSPYANIVAIRKDEKGDPRIKQLVASLHSQAVQDKAKKLFGDGAIPAW